MPGRVVPLATALVLLAAAPAAGQGPELVRVTTGPGDTGSLLTELAIASQDGTRVVLRTNEDLLAEDASPLFDFYDRAGDTLRLLTRPPADETQKNEDRTFAASADARRVLLEGYTRWTADDRDGHTKDVFAVQDGVTELVSTGPGDAHRAGFDAEPQAASRDARRVVFAGAERLTADDRDAVRDVFVREGATTTKLSPGDDAHHADAVGASADARRVVLATGSRLLPSDTDDRLDLFLVDGTSVVAQLSPGNDAATPELRALSDDGLVAVISTAERVLPAQDADDRPDLYRVTAGGDVQLVSPGPLPADAGEPGVFGVFLTADGGKVGFSSQVRHTADDADDQLDVFVWSAGGTIVKASPGDGPWPAALAGGADDLSRVVVTTYERLTADDADGFTDAFDVDVATRAVARVTTGPRGGNDAVELTCPFDRFRHPCGEVALVSPDGRRIVFETRERLVAEDTDDAKDVYQRAGGVTALLSPARPGRAADHEVVWSLGAVDGSVGYLETPEQLTADDVNRRSDGFRLTLPPVGTAGPPAPPAGGAPTGETVPDPLPPGTLGPGVLAPAPAGAGAGPAARTPARVRVVRRTPVVRRSGRALRLVTRARSGLPLAVTRATRLRVRVDRCRDRACRRAGVVAAATLRARAGRQALVLGGPRLRRGLHRVVLLPAGGRAVRVLVGLR